MDPTNHFNPKIQKDGSGDEDEKDKFTGAEQGSGDEGAVDHGGEVMLMSVDDDDTLLQQLQEQLQERHQRQLEELEKQMQRKMDKLEQQLQERSDTESGPPGLPRQNLASLERLNLGTQAPPPGLPRRNLASLERLNLGTQTPPRRSS